jgi:hypothetical protein
VATGYRHGKNVSALADTDGMPDQHRDYVLNDLQAMIVERTIRIFRFADEMFTEGLVSLGGANDFKKKAIFWAGWNMGMERGSNKNVRTLDGRKPRIGDGYEVEHAMPQKELIKLISATDLDPAEVWHLLSTYLVTYYVTKEEHDRLKNLGLQSKMPDDWDGVDPLARYRAAEIDVSAYAQQPIIDAPNAETPSTVSSDSPSS